MLRMAKMCVYKALRRFLQKTVNHHPIYFLSFNLRAQRKVISDSLIKLKETLTDVLIACKNQHIPLSIPANSANKKCSQEFLDFVLSILPEKLQIIIRGLVEYYPEICKLGAKVEARKLAARHLASLINTARSGHAAARTATTAAARATARATARTATKAVVGISLFAAAVDGYSIYSTWTTENEIVKEIENHLMELK